MKKLILSACALLVALTCKADGGMWFLELMEKQHLVDSLKKAGLQIKASEVYNRSGLSIKDAVCVFGGGCTGEIVSPNGLILTNHHCGYHSVQENSTPEHDYLKDGYFAHSQSEEMPLRGLQITFVSEFKDVTDRVKAYAAEQDVDEFMMQSGQFLYGLAHQMLAEYGHADEVGWDATILPYYDGNSFYFFLEKTYGDVRCVANPPLNIGQFGGDSDNWVWPRQGCDAAMFRVYGDANGNPTLRYEESNVPLKTEKFLTLSTRGYEEGDYAMIMGFPGSTSRFLSEPMLRKEMNAYYQPIFDSSRPITEFMHEEMDANDSVRFAWSNEYFSYANMSKNFGGALKAVKKEGLYDKARERDRRVTEYGRKINNKNYVEVVGEMEKLEKAYTDTLYDFYLSYICFTQNECMVASRSLEAYEKALESGDSTDIALLESDLLNQIEKNEKVDRALNVRRTALANSIFKKKARLACSQIDVPAAGELEYHSIFSSKKNFEEFCKMRDVEKLKNDPMNLVMKVRGIRDELRPAVLRYSEKEASLKKTYTAAILELTDGQTPPDANFSLRLTYGHVRSLSPRDGLHYDYQTTLDGMIEKADPDLSDYELNTRLKQLYDRKDFGEYARADGKLPACFITDNDITGGNSGSPVMDSKGRLIGLAFDGNIESLSCDFAFNERLQRSINVDIRFVLWMIDRFGGAKYVFDELKIDK